MNTFALKKISIIALIFVLFGCEKGQKEMTDYVITIPQEIMITADPENTTHFGSLAENDVEVNIDPHAFESAQVIKLHTPSSIPDLEDGQKLAGSPIEIFAAEQDSVRLAQKTRIIFKFDKDLITNDIDESFVRIGYFNGEKWEYIRPADIDMDAGLVTLETYHFSLLAPKISDSKKITEQFIHSQSLDNIIRDDLNNRSDFVTDQIVTMTLTKMGITDPEMQKKVFDKVASAEAYKEIYDLYQKGDSDAANQKVALLAGEKIVEIVPASALKDALGGVIGVADDIEKAAQAAGYAAEGQYKEAAKIIGENIADKFLITTATKIAVEVVDGQIQNWKNAEVDAAYQAYKNGADGYFWGYNVDAGDFDTVWDQMRGVGRQLEIEAIKKENAIRTAGGMPELSEKEEALVRARVKRAYKRQFEKRSEKEDIITAEEEKLKMIFTAFEKADLFSNAIGPRGLDKGYTYETKLEMLHHFAQKMMRDVDRKEITERDFSDTKLSTNDLAIAAKKYFSEPNGKEQYEEYIKERFDIGLYPKIDEIAGSWSGTITITEVVASEEIKAQQSSGNGDEEGCDIIALEDMIGVANPVTLTVKPTGKSGGMITMSSEEDGKPMPFTYYSGVLEAPIYEDNAEGKIHLTASKNGDALVMDGSAYLNYGNDDVKIKASIAVTK
jgi:hypothetical protein